MNRIWRKRVSAAAGTLLASTLVAGCSGGRGKDSGTEQAPLAASSVAPTPETWVRAHSTFGDYWHAGKAELTSYDLTQVRYGEERKGEAVLIFVTEDFLPDAQVKHEHGPGPSVPILKLNAHRRFFTGIYPYSVLVSIFTPLPKGEARGMALKATASVQEWCGHTYLQLNRRGEMWNMVSHSYFQNEGDQRGTIEGAPTEDGLFTQIRLDPSVLPTGDMALVPGLHSLRFDHRVVAPERASVSVVDAPTEQGENLRLMEVYYPASGRRLRVWFGKAFPYLIHRWEERDDQNPDLVTRAVRARAIVTDYWNHNRVEDDDFREALGLRPAGILPTKHQGTP